MTHQKGGVRMFPYVEVSGKPFERGKAIGEKAKKQIHHNITAYQKLFQHFADIDWATAKSRAEAYVTWIERYDPDIFEEIRGISEGAGVDLLDIVALNARSEIILNADGCTSVAAIPPSTVNQVTLLAQNWDWGSLLSPGMILLQIDQSPLPKILMITEAGIVGKIGMNNFGLGVCLNLLGTADRKEGVPIHVLLRGILNSKTLPQAVGQAARMTRGTSANFLIAHKEGEALNLEMTPDDYDVLYPESDWIAHANHFIGPRAVNLLDTARIKYPDTHVRQGRINRLMKGKSNITADIIKVVLQDHHGYPDGICRHGEDYPVEPGRQEAVNTVLSVVMNLTDGVFEITDGPPCQASYQTYHFETNAYERMYVHD